MNVENIVHAYTLPDGIQAVVSDATSHYYGGYYHVKLQILIEIPVVEDYFESRAAFESAVNNLGNPVIFRRLLDKMAVPETDVEHVRQNLLHAFEANLLPYLERADFPRRFVTGEYAKFLGTVPHVRTWQSS